MPKIEQFIDLNKFADDVKIDNINVSESFMDQASLFAYYAGMHFKAMKQAANAKIMRDGIYAQVDHEIRQENVKLNAEKTEKEKPEKLTETMISAMIDRSPRYITAKKEYNDAEAILEFIKNALEAFKQRRDMLISFGATVREEMKGDLRMRETQADRVQARVTEVVQDTRRVA